MFNKGKTKEKKERPSKAEMQASIQELIAAEEELKALKKEYGIEDEKEQAGAEKKEGRISRMISAFFERQENREKIAVSKKRYIWLAVLTGWVGGHRFYSKHYKVALFYLLFFWMGMGLYHSIIDIMQVIPMEADEKGMIYL